MYRLFLIQQVLRGNNDDNLQNLTDDSNTTDPATDLASNTTLTLLNWTEIDALSSNSTMDSSSVDDKDQQKLRLNGRRKSSKSAKGSGSSHIDEEERNRGHWGWHDNWWGSSWYNDYWWKPSKSSKWWGGGGSSWGWSGGSHGNVFRDVRRITGIVGIGTNVSNDARDGEEAISLTELQ